MRDIRGFSSFYAKSVFRGRVSNATARDSFEALPELFEVAVFQLVARNLHASREVNKSYYGRDLCLSRVKDNTVAGEVLLSGHGGFENAFPRGNSVDRGLSSNSKLWQRVAI